MKLYDTPRAPNPRRVRMFLAEKGLTIPREEINLIEGGAKTDAFRTINPMQSVPVLVLDDGTALAETHAICRYVEEAVAPEPNLMGRDARERALIEMWNRRVEFGLFFHIAQVFRHLHPRLAALEQPQLAVWGEANRPKAVAQLAFWDGELGRRRFMAGDRFTIADITGLVAVDMMPVARIERPAGLNHLARWHGEVASRPSAEA
ncbi:MAG: glutathione S-transferase [Hyphomicrobiaceae bacterium]